MTHTIPKCGWVSILAATVQNAKPGDIIEVDSDAKVELARRAMNRLCITDVEVQMVKDK